jgi:hypothetical protein
MPASDETRRKNEIAKKLATARWGTAGDVDANAAAKARWQEISAMDIAAEAARRESSNIGRRLGTVMRRSSG